MFFKQPYDWFHVYFITVAHTTSQWATEAKHYDTSPMEVICSIVSFLLFYILGVIRVGGGVIIQILFFFTSVRVLALCFPH